jgi:hypothetical protein
VNPSRAEPRGAVTGPSRRAARSVPSNGIHFLVQSHDVAQRDVYVHQGARHTEGFVTETSGKEGDGSLGDRDAFRIERQCDHVAMCVYYIGG